MASYTTSPNYFDSADDVLRADDAVEMDINVEGWEKSLRIRSLTVPQRDKINRAAGVGTDRDWVQYCIFTIVEGVVRPKFTTSQASQLVNEHNGQPVEELCEAIWLIGGLFNIYKRYLEEQKKVNELKEQLPDNDG